MNFPGAIVSGFINFANFRGRASRSEFWFWMLFMVIANSVLGPIGDAGNLVTFLMLALAVPTMAVAVRRLHDIGRSGGSLLTFLIPFAGPFITLSMLARESTPGGNQYGANPLGVYSVDEYQSQQYLPSMGRPQLTSPVAFPGHTFNFGDTPEPELVPVKARAEQDQWAQEFNKLHQQARPTMPKVYRMHYFTDTELDALQAGQPQAVLLSGDAGNDFYLAEVAWNGDKFTETRIGV